MSAVGRTVERMTDPDEKAMLQGYLQRQRDALLWKLEGLGEREARLPMTPTGTNLLGLVKHAAHMEYGYLGDVFGRPAADPLLVDFDTAEDNADMWAAAGESKGDVIAFYRRAQAHADATIEALELSAAGTVPWWPEERRHPTLHRVLVHLVQELARHAGHADIVRELVDGAAGMLPTASNLPDESAAGWAAYRARLQAVADSFDENAE
jgi:hypothetical protein